jgi:hypothetical protein
LSSSSVVSGTNGDSTTVTKGEKLMHLLAKFCLRLATLLILAWNFCRLSSLSFSSSSNDTSSSTCRKSIFGSDPREQSSSS